MTTNKDHLKPFNDFLNTPSGYIVWNSETKDGIDKAWPKRFHHRGKVFKELFEHYQIDVGDGGTDRYDENTNELLYRLILDRDYGVNWEDQKEVEDLLNDLLLKHVPALSVDDRVPRKMFTIMAVDYFTTIKTSKNQACDYLHKKFGFPKGLKARYGEYKKDKSILDMSILAQKMLKEEYSEKERKRFYTMLVKELY